MREIDDLERENSGLGALDDIENCGDEKIQKEFHFNEFNSIRSEIMYFIEELNRMERSSLIGIVAVYAFLLSKDYSAYQYLSAVFWFVPSIVIYYTLRKFMSIRMSIWHLASYLTRMHGRYADPTIGGWEVYMRSQDDVKSKVRQAFSNQMLAWKIGLLLSLVVAALVVADSVGINFLERAGTLNFSRTTSN